MTGARQTIAVMVTSRKSNKSSLECRLVFIGWVRKKTTCVCLT